MGCLLFDGVHNAVSHHISQTIRGTSPLKHAQNQAKRKQRPSVAPEVAIPRTFSPG
jgi:hypothetical protein